MQDKRQLVLLLVAVGMIGLGGWQVLAGDVRPVWSIVLRAGIVLAVIWMAWPELLRVRLKERWPILVGLLALALALVMRPKLAPLVIAGGIAAIVLNWLIQRAVRALRR